MDLNLDPDQTGTPQPVTGTRDQQAARELVRVIDDLAEESGYHELHFAPVLIAGHSAASPFVWPRTVYQQSPLADRVFAILPYKGFYPGGAPRNIPIFHVSSEWDTVDSDCGYVVAPGQTEHHASVVVNAPTH